MPRPGPPLAAGLFLRHLMITGRRNWLTHSDFEIYVRRHVELKETYES